MTVRFRPMRPIRIPVGSEQTANQRKTIMGSRLAMRSLSEKSAFT